MIQGGDFTAGNGTGNSLTQLISGLIRLNIIQNRWRINLWY